MNTLLFSSNDPPAIHLLDLWPKLQTVWRQRLRVQILSAATTTTAHPPFTFSSCYNVGIAFLSHVKNPAFPEIFWPRVNRHNLSRSDFFALISLLGLSEKWVVVRFMGGWKGMNGRLDLYPPKQLQSLQTGQLISAIGLFCYFVRSTSVEEREEIWVKARFCIFNPNKHNRGPTFPFILI